jgi:hypothetical protein
MVVRDRRGRGEVASVDSATKWGSSCRILMLVSGGCSGKSCSSCIQNSAKKEISRRANCQVFAPAVLEIRRAPQETGFFAPVVFYSRRAPCGRYVWRSFLSVLLDRRPCPAKLLNSLSINLLKSLCACSPCFISRRAKSNTPGAKTALREILLLL